MTTKSVKSFLLPLIALSCCFVLEAYGYLAQGNEATINQSASKTGQINKVNGVSIAEITSSSIATLHKENLIVSGTPQVLLARPITPAQMPSLGLSGPNTSAYPKGSLILVVFEGDFNPHWPITRPLTWHGKYLAAMFTLKDYKLIYTHFSATIDSIQQVLNSRNGTFNEPEVSPPPDITPYIPPTYPTTPSASPTAIPNLIPAVPTGTSI